MPPLLPTLALSLLVPLGIYTTWVLLENNDTSAFMMKARESGFMPDTNGSAPIRTHYTGIAALDNQLATFAVFFWPVLDGKNAALSLQANHFGAQFVVAYGLMCMEAMRGGGSRWPLVGVAIWGLLIQVLTFAATIPLYALVNLFTTSSLEPTKKNVTANASLLATLVPSLILGFVVPGKIMAWSAPEDLSYDTKQLVMTAWQIFPVWVAQWQFGQSSVLTISKKYYPQLMRITYGLLILVGASAHISALYTSISATLTDSASPLHIMNVWVPKMWTLDGRVSTIAEGSHLLLQYDLSLGVTALMVWVATLYRRAPASTCPVPLPAKIAVFITFLGPGACAAILMWSRDMRVLREKKVVFKKKE